MNCYSPVLSKKIGLYNAVVLQELKRAYSFEANFDNEYIELYITSDMIGITEKQYRKALDNLELMGFIETANIFSIGKSFELYRILKVTK